DLLEVVPGGTVDSHQIAATLAKSSHMIDGRYRAIASRWIEGKPLGASPGSGVRKDDPNDRISHDRRRDLRGMAVVYAWLDMADVWPGNLLDVWTADNGKHYVKHYVLDFDGGFGMLGTVTRDLCMGHEYEFDWGATTKQTVTLGMEQRTWETRPKVNVPGVGITFTAEDLHPDHWRPALPYTPFMEAD